jgi:hypothetical protein
MQMAVEASNILLVFRDGCSRLQCGSHTPLRNKGGQDFFDGPGRTVSVKNCEIFCMCIWNGFK